MYEIEIEIKKNPRGQFDETRCERQGMCEALVTEGLLPREKGAILCILLGALDMRPNRRALLYHPSVSIIDM